jgi:type II secretory pathway pseudopilin PulG
VQVALKRPMQNAPPSVRRNSGFTVAELITVVAVIMILAAMAVPVIRFGTRRQRELDLRARLHKIDGAIDQYIDMRLKGLMKNPPSMGQDMFPKNLEELTKPVMLIDGRQVVLLRERDLIDPMTGKSDFATSSNTDSSDSASSNEDNVWDVHSSSTALSLDGKTHYNEW